MSGRFNGGNASFYKTNSPAAAPRPADANGGVLAVTVVSQPAEVLLDANMESFIGWLTRKTHNVMQEPVKYYWLETAEALQLQLILSRPQDIPPLLRIDNFSYANSRLRIKRCTADDLAYAVPAQFRSPDVTLLLQDFIRSRYDVTRQMCDLSQLHAVGPLMQKFGQAQMTAGAYNALFFRLAVVFPQCETLVLNGNQLKSLYMLNGLSHHLPNIVNLSLADNQVAAVQSVCDVLGNQCKSGLAKLRELIMSQNPVAAGTDQAAHLKYRLVVARCIPSLTILDGVPIDRSTAATVSTSSSVVNGAAQAPAIPVKFPLEPRGKFYDKVESQQMVESFLAQYMRLFDGNRMDLQDAYALNDCQFSVSVNDFVTHLQDEVIRNEPEYALRSTGGTNSNNAPNIDMIRASRNVKILSADATSKLIKIGSKNIVQMLCKLPRTQHLDPTTNCVIDSWQVPASSTQPPRLFVCMSGLFQVSIVTGTSSTASFGTGKSIVRQYNRSMVLIPSPPTSAAFINKTWPVQIINDMLTVVPVMTDELSASIVEKAKRSASARGRGGRYQRASANPKLVVVKNLSLLTKVAPLPVVIGVQQQQQPAVAAVQNQQPQLSADQLELARQFSHHTRLNMEFSCLCLQEQGWDGNKALAVFQHAQQQGIIPPNAFLPQQ